MSFNDIIVVAIIILIFFWSVIHILKWLGIYIKTHKQLNLYDETKNTWTRIAINETRKRLISLFLLLVAMIFAFVFLLFVK